MGNKINTEKSGKTQMCSLTNYCKMNTQIKTQNRDFPGGPVVKTPCFHCREHGFNLRSGKFHMLHGAAKKKKTQNITLPHVPLADHNAFLSQ